MLVLGMGDCTREPVVEARAVFLCYVMVLQYRAGYCGPVSRTLSSSDRSKVKFNIAGQHQGRSSWLRLFEGNNCDLLIESSL